MAKLVIGTNKQIVVPVVAKEKQPVIDTLNVTPTTSAQTITAPSGTDGYSPVNVSAVDSSIDANIVAGNIKSGVSILGVNGSVVELNGTTTSVTPTTSAQTITPTAPNNGFTEVSVSAVTSAIDANIQAGNIKKDVTILGVTGSFEGGTTPTGTLPITANGTFDVTNYASAEVSVPTSTPELYRVFGLNNGMIPIVAYNYGARNGDRILQTIKLSVITAMVIMAVYMIGRCVNTVTINGVLDGGGDTLFDMYSLAVCMWGVAIPLALLGAFVFHWPVLLVYACTCLDEVGKIPWVMLRFRKYKWVQNLTR